MHHFPQLITKRLTVAMRELTIGQAIAVAKYPDASAEAATTHTLRACSDCPVDPLYWTLQERMLGIGHYLMCVNTDQPDFAIGEGVFTDYLQSEREIDARDLEAPMVLGTVEGDTWAMNHLMGYMLESIERTQGLAKVRHDDGTEEAIPVRLHWVMGTMAAQMVRVQIDEHQAITKVLTESPEPGQLGAYDEWLIKGIEVLANYPDNAFAAARLLYQMGAQRQLHLFDWMLGLDDGRPVALPNPEKEAAAVLPPATFPADACISPAARELGGNMARAGS